MNVSACSSARSKSYLKQRSSRGAFEKLHHKNPDLSVFLTEGITFMFFFLSMPLTISVPLRSDVEMGEQHISGPFSAQQLLWSLLLLSPLSEYLFQCFLNAIGCDCSEGHISCFYAEGWDPLPVPLLSWVPQTWRYEEFSVVMHFLHLQQVLPDRERVSVYL